MCENLVQSLYLRRKHAFFESMEKFRSPQPGFFWNYYPFSRFAKKGFFKKFEKFFKKREICDFPEIGPALYHFSGKSEIFHFFKK